jgi:hypothetical protein
VVYYEKLYKAPLDGGSHNAADYELPITALFDPRGIDLY